MWQLSGVHIPGAPGPGPLTSFVPCALSPFPADLLPGIVRVGHRGDPRLYAICEGGNVADNVPGNVTAGRCGCLTARAPGPVPAPFGIRSGVTCGEQLFPANVQVQTWCLPGIGRGSAGISRVRGLPIALRRTGRGSHAARQTAGGVAPDPGPVHIPVTCRPGLLLPAPGPPPPDPGDHAAGRGREKSVSE